MSQDLAGQTVVVIGGTAGIGLETARRARAHGAELILAARNPDRLNEVGRELEARTAAFDASIRTRRALSYANAGATDWGGITDLALGESIALNGACLTVRELGDGWLYD